MVRASSNGSQPGSVSETAPNSSNLLVGIRPNMIQSLFLKEEEEKLEAMFNTWLGG